MPRIYLLVSVFVYLFWQRGAAYEDRNGGHVDFIMQLFSTF